MKRYISLDMDAVKENDLKITHWIMLENIDFLQNNDTGWCYASRSSFAKWLDVGDRTIYNILDKLTSKKLIEIHPETKYIRTTKKYKELVSCKKAVPMQKVQMSSAKSADEPMQKVQTLPIKEENEGREEGREPSPKFKNYMDLLDFLKTNGKNNHKIEVEFEGIKVGVSKTGVAYNKVSINDLPRKQETRFLKYLLNNLDLLDI